MALDPVRLADTQAWLTKVASDLRGAEIDLAAMPPLLDDDEPVPTVEEATAALALAREVVAAIVDRLPPETRP